MPHHWMERALTLARQADAAPNPRVGAVLVRDGLVIGEGFHRGPGTPHAEAAALDDAHARGHDPRGATLFVTLEPCCHSGPGKRTPPCAQRLVREGVAEVWAGCPDPNPQVSGGGRALLVEAGVRFHWGPCEHAARELIADFAAWIEGRPLFTLKWAQSLNGVLTRQPESRWISGPESRQEAHRLRAGHDAVAVGAGTLRTDDPALTVRDLPETPVQPRRLIFAGAQPLPESAQVFRDRPESTWLVVVPGSAAARQAPGLVGDHHLEWDGRQPNELAQRLFQSGFHRVLVEGGPRLLSSFLNGGLWDRVAVFIAPVLLPVTEPPVTGPSEPWFRPVWYASGTDGWLTAWNPASPVWAAADKEVSCLPDSSKRWA